MPELGFAIYMACYRVRDRYATYEEHRTICRCDIGNVEHDQAEQIHDDSNPGNHGMRQVVRFGG